MTTDPRRWLDDPELLDDGELRALVAGRDAAPPPQLRAELWSSLAARLPPDALGGGAQGGSNEIPPGTGAQGPALGGPSELSVAGVGAGVLVKALGVGAVAGTVVVAGLRWANPVPEPPRAAPAVTAPSAARASAPAPSVRPGLPVHARPAPAVEASARREPQKVSPARVEPSGPVARPQRELPASADAASGAREESRLVALAREALRAGDAREALRTLSVCAERFPNGILTQEREALVIEALARSGALESARSRGAAFLRVYPKSPYAARVKAAIDAR